MFVKAKLAPGINKRSTRTQAIGTWWESNNIRFNGGVAESVLGWSDEAEVEIHGFARKIHSWVSLSGNLYTIVGTNQKLYIVWGNAVYDITPFRGSVDATTIIFTTSGGDSLITIDHVSHGANVGDWITTDGITFTGAVFGVVPLAIA